MRLHRLHVAHFRGIDDQRLEFAPSGVTVVLGPNEVGKSSLVEALNLLFEYLDSSQAEAVRAVQPVGKDVGSEVAVEGETGPYRFRYRKRFHRDRETVLEVLEPTPEKLTGREAHDRMEAILDETLDRRLWEALRVEQGQGFDQAELGEARSLLDALDRAAGGDSGGGEREESLFAKVKQEVERYYTATRRAETGELRDARQEAEAARERETRLADGLAELEADAERFDRMEIRRRELERDADSVEREAEEAAEARRRVEEMRAEAVSLRQTLERREDRLERLRDLFEAERAEAGLIPELRTARQELAEAEEALKPLSTTAEEAREAVEAAEALRELRRRDEVLLDQRERLARTRRALETVLEADRRRAELEERLAELPVTSQDVERIGALERRLGEAEAAHAAGSPEIRLRAEAELGLEVEAEEGARETVALEPGETWSRRSARGLKLRLPGVAELELTPGGGARELVRQVETLRRDLEDAVQEVLGDACPPDATPGPDLVRELHGERRRLENERAVVRADRQRALDGRDPEELEQRVETLGEAIAKGLADRPSEPPLAEDGDGARQAHEAAEARLTRTRQDLATAEKAHREAADRSDAIRRTVERLELELGSLRERAAQARERLHARGELPKAEPDAGSTRKALIDEAREDDPLAAALAAAERARDETRRRLAQRERRLEEADPDAVVTRAAAAEERREEVERELKALDGELAELRGRLEALGRQGLFERHEEAAVTAERAERRLASLEARAGAARRLYETLSEAREEARRSYHRPLADKIGELGRNLYGDGFEVCLSDDLAIAERVFQGRRLPFDQLSTGAREQLALLARLASALLVAPEGGGAPLILDDVLGHTDPERLIALRRILAKAGEQCQVVILTSDPERYGDVDGARFVEM